MKNVYLARTRAMNGTVVANEMFAAFLDKDVAEKAAKAVDESNQREEFMSTVTDVKEIPLFENESEVPILNKRT